MKWWAKSTIPNLASSSPMETRGGVSARLSSVSWRSLGGGNSIENIWAWVSAWKNGLRFRFYSETCLNYPFFKHFLSVGNLKPKLKWFFKPKLKPKIFCWIGPQDAQSQLQSTRASVRSSSRRAHNSGSRPNQDWSRIISLLLRSYKSCNVQYGPSGRGLRFVDTNSEL